MPIRSRKLSRDPNSRAFEIVRLATGQTIPEPEPEKNAHAVALGRLGGQKGGKARAAKMSKQSRSMSARKAAQARWRKHR